MSEAASGVWDRGRRRNLGGLWGFCSSKRNQGCRGVAVASHVHLRVCVFLPVSQVEYGLSSPLLGVSCTSRVDSVPDCIF